MDHLGEASVVGGRFRLIEPVGTGRPAGVWRAVDLASGQDVAVKILDTFSAGDTAAQARFRLVARTAAQLSAPGLAEVLDFGEAELDGGRTVPYLVRELVSGPTLDDRLSRGPLPAAEALRVVAEVAAALVVAHRAGLAHGHLVPGNIVVTPERVKVTDGGLWPLRPRPAGGPVPGGLGYAAPELAHGPVTPAADMYALGVVFVACLAGIASGGPRPGGEVPGGESAAGVSTGEEGPGEASMAGPGPAGTGELPEGGPAALSPPVSPRCGRPAWAPIPRSGRAPRTPRSCRASCCPGGMRPPSPPGRGGCRPRVRSRPRPSWPRPAQAPPAFRAPARPAPAPQAPVRGRMVPLSPGPVGVARPGGPGAWTAGGQPGGAGGRS